MMPSGRRLPQPLAAPRARSAAAAAPSSAPRRRGPALPPPVPRAGLLPPSPGAAPASGGPCQLQQTNRRGGGDVEGTGMLKPWGPRPRAQPARRLSVAQLLWVSEDRLVHSWPTSPGPRRLSASRTPPEKRASKYPCPERFETPGPARRVHFFFLMARKARDARSDAPASRTVLSAKPRGWKAAAPSPAGSGRCHRPPSI